MNFNIVLTPELIILFSYVFFGTWIAFYLGHRIGFRKKIKKFRKEENRK